MTGAMMAGRSVISLKIFQVTDRLSLNECATVWCRTHLNGEIEKVRQSGILQTLGIMAYGK